MSVPLLNAAGRRRAPVTLPGYLAGRPPRNKGLRYPPDPPTVEEIVAVMRQAGDGVHGARMRAFIVLLWRAGLRINEALTVTEHDLDPRLGAVLVRHGKGVSGRPPRRLARLCCGSTSVPIVVGARRRGGSNAATAGLRQPGAALAGRLTGSCWPSRSRTRDAWTPPRAGSPGCGAVRRRGRSSRRPRCPPPAARAAAG
jgi:hypothetical protein